jgi:precorrin-2/cobalt-factor-2 C20-methyltransferase
MKEGRKGKLYGIGVGPGDPELMTLRAVKLIEKSGVIAYPVSKRGEEGTALEIVKGAADISGKKIVELLFSMNPDDNVRKKCRADAIGELISILDSGTDVAMITLGDVAVYSTYMYLDKKIREAGFETEAVPGIPSFCSGAASARLPLMIGNESLAVISMAKNNDEIGKALSFSDNVVAMKARNSMDKILDAMESEGLGAENATVVSNVGMDGEYIGPIDRERKYGYFTTVIIKKKAGDGE